MSLVFEARSVVLSRQLGQVRRLRVDLQVIADDRRPASMHVHEQPPQRPDSSQRSWRRTRRKRSPRCSPPLASGCPATAWAHPSRRAGHCSPGPAPTCPIDKPLRGLMDSAPGPTACGALALHVALPAVDPLGAHQVPALTIARVLGVVPHHHLMPRHRKELRKEAGSKRLLLLTQVVGLDVGLTPEGSLVKAFAPRHLEQFSREVISGPPP